MDGNAAKWWQVYRLRHGIGTWEEFMAVVQEKFGAYDYKHAIDKMLELLTPTQHAAEP